MSYLIHHGILGQKWGVRRYQNPDGSLTPVGQKRREIRDAKWVDKHADKIYKKVLKKSRRQLNKAERKLNRTAPFLSGKRYVLEYNRQMAEIMNANASKIPPAPSGKVIKFIAKRGEIGVHMALADPDYDLSTVKNGVYGDGRVAYKKNTLNKM